MVIMTKSENDEKPIISISSSLSQPINTGADFKANNGKMKSENDPKTKALHIKQIAKRSIEIIKEITSLKKISKIPIGKVFLSPMQISIKKKRWEDFSAYTKRSLFTLNMKKSSIKELLGDIDVESSSFLKIPGNLLINLSSLCRSTLYILKGLERFTIEIQENNPGFALLKKSLSMAEEILFIVSKFNPKILPPHQQAKIKKHKALSPEITKDTFHDTITDDTINISTSDWNSEAREVLNPSRLKNSITKLAKKHNLVKKNKQKKIKKQYKIINLLRGNKKNPLPFPDETLEGKTEKTSPNQQKKEKKKKISDVKKVSKKPVLKKTEPVRPSYVSKTLKSTKPHLKTGDSKLNSQKVLNTTFTQTNIEELQVPAHENTLKSKQFDESSFKEKLSLVSEKLDLLEKQFDAREQFVVEMDTFLESRPIREDPFDLEKAIKEANASMEQLERELNPQQFGLRTEEQFLQDSKVTQLVEVKNPSLQFEHNLPLTMHQEILAQKEEFWSNLVRRNCIEVDEQELKTQKQQHTNDKKTASVKTVKIKLKKETKSVQVGTSLYQENSSKENQDHSVPEDAFNGSSDLIEEPISFYEEESQEISEEYSSNIPQEEPTSGILQEESVPEESHLNDQNTSQMPESLATTCGYSSDFSENTGTDTNKTPVT